jgi:hypothetical protein
VSYEWGAGGVEHQLRLVQVPGTNGKPYLFGADPDRRPVEVHDFHIATTPVTQALWMHVMDSNPSVRPDLRCPVENVSWDQITGASGFLERINSSSILAVIAGADRALRFRLPSGTEWEYAARGTPGVSGRLIGLVRSGLTTARLAGAAPAPQKQNVVCFSSPVSPTNDERGASTIANH